MIGFSKYIYLFTYLNNYFSFEPQLCRGQAFEITTELFQEDRSDGFVSEPIDKGTKTPGKYIQTHIKTVVETNQRDRKSTRLNSSH